MNDQNSGEGLSRLWTRKPDDIKSGEYNNLTLSGRIAILELKVRLLGEMVDIKPEKNIVVLKYLQEIERIEKIAKMD
ncbi:MAG: hypothetical protein PHX80_03880 [Candidatus Nanoarchaeia archaeon]|nr:hypothetical protein [Candidatus Nanoarchaeia archaeon]